MQLLHDILSAFEPLFVFADPSDEQFVYPLVGPDERITGIFDQCLFEAEMGDGVFNGVVDDLGDGAAVLGQTGIVQLVDVVDDLAMLSVDDIDAGVEVVGPCQVSECFALGVSSPLAEE